MIVTIRTIELNFSFSLLFHLLSFTIKLCYNDMVLMSGIWLDEIQAAMADLGGDASYSDLNQRIQERNNIDLSSRKDWRAQVRGTIERFSSDSKVFAGKSDIFYSVGGIRSGHWGLRNFQATIENVNLTEDDIEFPEGKKILRQHICRERNPKVIDQAKKNF